MHRNIEIQRRFWEGDGPCLILIPPPEGDAYTLEDYPNRFENPSVMWNSEFVRAQRVADWPTDGIPTIRPNLGVIFIPAMAGLSYKVQPDQMPWPGEPLDRSRIRAARGVDVTTTDLMRRAEAFYTAHRELGDGDIVPYHADTQGVFDIAHLLYGEELFYELPDQDEVGWIAELMDICYDLYVRTSQHLKGLLGEAPSEMIHGHGTSQGLYFPHAGVRMAEDTATLLSPGTIERVILPAIERAAQPFGGAFVHYCGRHSAFFEQLCRMECVRAIDLGNPEMYDTSSLLERCGETGTVLYSRVAPESETETWEAYVRRLAAMVNRTGARVALRPAIVPKTREECAAMRDLWHELTR